MYICWWSVDNNVCTYPIIDFTAKRSNNQHKAANGRGSAIYFQSLLGLNYYVSNKKVPFLCALFVGNFLNYL